MHRHVICVLAAVILVGSIVEDAEAQRRRRGGYSGGSLVIAPYTDARSENHKPLSVYYNYNGANQESVAFTDKVRVFLAIRDKQLRDNEQSMVAEVKITDLSDVGSTKTRYYPLTLENKLTAGYRFASFDVTNHGEAETLVAPNKVYRMFINLHRPSAEIGNQTVLGRVPWPYYVATSGDTPLEFARQQIVMRTFKEFYYLKRGWDSGENYPMDCYAYYMWATGFCTVGAQDGRTQLWSLFGNEVPYHNGGQIAALAKTRPIQADYVRIPGHSFMLLSYDQKRGQAWTMEGNFNSTVEVVVRSVDSGWTVGHLRERHIRPGLFPRLRERLRGMRMTSATE